MKNKGLIVAFSCACIFVVALIATIVVLASGNQNVGSNVSLIYVASDIAGSVSGTYQVGNNPAKDMTTSSGAKVVSFSADTPESLSLLSPNETINMLYGEDVILTYTFTSTGEEYYAHMSYSDTDTPYTNLVFNYKKESDSSYATNASKVVTVPRLGSTTFSVKISIENPYLNASLNGTIDWALTKEKPILVEEQVNLNIANNAGSIIDNDTFSYQTRTVDGKKQFKIVGATPIIDSTSTSGYVYYDRTTLASTGKVSSIDDLTNNNGAEFFYFCTNPAVVGSTGYNDPGEIYYTSTSDTDLESWYDIPTSETQLYACFMTPNYITEELYTGSDIQIIISNKVVNIRFKVFYNNSSITDVAIPQSVINIGYGNYSSYGAFQGCSKLQKAFIPGSVTVLGYNAFSGCSKLTNVTIGAGVTSIGSQTFRSCSALTDVTISNTVTSIGSFAFYNCSRLTSIVIPDSVTSIKDKAFWDCSKLTSLTIGAGVISIGERAFGSCTGLTSIIIPNSVTSIGEKVFYGCSGLTEITIPNSVTNIGDYAFYDCSKLTSIMIPNCVTKIGRSVFYGCSGLTSITIPNSVTSIGIYAFYGCRGLTSITIPNSVTEIGDYAFENCVCLTSVNIPVSVTSIGVSPFRSCRGLTSIMVSTNNATYYSSGNCLIKKSDTSLIQGCKTSVIPDGVTSIGNYAFSGCSDLTSITIPAGVTSIGDYAFRYCSGLTSIIVAENNTVYYSSGNCLIKKSDNLLIKGCNTSVIPNGVKSIGREAFYGCSGLTSIPIPNSVAEIGPMAFENCSGLTSITIPESVTSIALGVFYGCSKLTSVTFADTSKTWTVKSGSTVKASNVSVANSAQNATYFKTTYKNYAWTKNS